MGDAKLIEVHGELPVSENENDYSDMTTTDLRDYADTLARACLKARTAARNAVGAWQWVRDQQTAVTKELTRRGVMPAERDDQ